VIIPAGYRLGVTLCGRDFTFSGEGPWPEAYGVRMRGNGIFVHTDERARPQTVFGGTTTLFTGGQHTSSLLLPIIPATDRNAGTLMAQTVVDPEAGTAGTQLTKS
jgi:hypothetical protein